MNIAEAVESSLLFVSVSHLLSAEHWAFREEVRVFLSEHAEPIACQ